MIQRKTYLPLLFCFIFAFAGWQTTFAQAGNQCDEAIFLPDVTNYCSGVAEFSNVNVGASNFGPAPCFSNNSNDIWFTFTSVATDVVVTVNGASGLGAGGTMNGPEIALYIGDCSSTITSIQCEVDDNNVNFTELNRGGLIVGATYLIRINSENNSNGTFQLCVNNFFPPALPGSDCIDATILCDKSPFSVQEIVGAGNDNDEAIGTCLSVGGFASESSSSWYTWTAATTGTLEFTLNPNNPSDDLDFVIFELPAGVQNCGGKIPLLCMASGDSQFPSPCMGPTGIRESSSDLEETFNCSEGDDNFVAALNMVAGTSYALLINNFTNTGSGFSITFGGSGEFVGPDADFTASATTICAGESVTFTDASSFGLGNIVGWNWTFGPGAVPTTINTQGPHNVTFNQPGLQTIVLTIETSLGCVLTTTEVINVEQCCDSVNPLIVNFTNTDLECAEDADGIIDITTSSNFPPFNYNWSDGESTEDRNNLGPGEYTVTITDNIGCEEIISVTLTSPPAYVYDATITMPSCDGGTDGAVNVTVSGATPPYTIVWIDELTGAFLTNDEDLLNIPIGDYTQTISDANGCILENTFEVRELELELDPTVEAITEPLCNGDSNGSIVVDIINGTPPYLFDFNDGNGPVPENALENIIAGSYNVVVFDVNNCMGNFTFEVGQPDSLKVELATNNVSCFGFTDGIVTALATGGTLPYTYNWSVPTNPDNPELTELPIGNYFLTLVDNNGCTITADTFITQPPELFIDEIQVVDNVCFGGSDGSLTIIASGGVPPYEYSLDNVTYQADLSFFNLPAGDFVGYVRDANGCFLSDLATIAQPLPITLEVFEDQTVDLGFTAELLAVNDSPDPFTYSWSPSESLDCSDCPIVNALPVNTTTYVVTLETSNGCIVMDSVTVEVNKVRPVYIPNAFTPNGDGVNDQFLVFGGRAVAQVQRLVIYDRWGELVFEANNIPTDAPSFGWDGTFRGQALNPGVLVYYTEVEFIDGVVEVYKGDVTIIR